MSKITWQVGAVSATTVYHDMLVGNCVTQNVWIAEYYMDGVKFYQFVYIPPGSDGYQNRYPLRSTFDEAKADAAMHYAEIELERP